MLRQPSRQPLSFVARCNVIPCTDLRNLAANFLARRIRLGVAKLMKNAVIVFVLFVASSSSFAQQSNRRPLFTEDTSVCAGRGFVAMVSFSRSQSLTIVIVSDEGIRSPQTIQTTGNDILGVQCMGSHLELEVREAGSDHASVLPFRILDGAIQREPREDIDWSISHNGTVPSPVERREDGFQMGAGSGMRGDWYYGVYFGPDRVYELHYVITDRDGTTKVTVDLLSETYGYYKVLQTIPLIHFESHESAD